MEQFSQFIVNNWQYISIGLVGLLEIVLFIVKKRSKTEIVDAGLYENLVVLITEAEKKFGAGKGEEKHDYVIQKLGEFKPYYLKWPSLIDFAIDSILNTPTMKGGLGREQVEQKKK